MPSSVIIAPSIGFKFSESKIVPEIIPGILINAKSIRVVSPEITSWSVFVSGWYPSAVAVTSYLSAGIPSIVYFPFAPVVVEKNVPSTTINAPSIGSVVAESVTIPEIIPGLPVFKKSAFFNILYLFNSKFGIMNVLSIDLSFPGNRHKSELDNALSVQFA